MAHLSKNKPAGRNIGKHLKHDVDAALHLLEKTRVSDTDVHRARKTLKKARASLRLLRAGLKDAAYRRENVALRDAARPLSAVRDAKVMLDTLRMLGDRYGEPARVLELDRLVRELRSRRTRTRHDVLSESAGTLAHTRRLLRQARARIDNLADRQHQGWKVVGAGLKRIYAQGQRALAQTRADPSPEAFHEWRKQAKHLRYALEMLEPLWPGLIGALADQTHKLADYLGDEHDLAVLRNTAVASRELFRDAATLPAFLALLERCQGELREKALFLGSRLYEEKPKAFAQRFQQYWKEWRDEQIPAPSPTWPPSTAAVPADARKIAAYRETAHRHGRLH